MMLLTQWRMAFFELDNEMKRSLKPNNIVQADHSHYTCMRTH